MTGKAPLLVILGPTAVGKTNLAIHIARALEGEIIGADSRQIYRYMDIGTAKPTPAQQAQAPHHLIGIVDPDENLTLAAYQDLAYQTINQVHRRGRLPLLVGGTGQYITAIVKGWSIPRVPPNHTLREELEDYAATRGKAAFHEWLNRVDPESAAKIHPNNVRRVIRALEVYLETGEPISQLQRKSPPPYEIYTLGIWLEREPLYQQADRRVDEMMEAGFLAEVRTVLERGYGRDLPAMSALGYGELASHLLGEIPLDDAVRKIKANTHDFIRRQEVWFRGHDHGILWHNITAVQPEKLTADIHEWLEEIG